MSITLPTTDLLSDQARVQAARAWCALLSDTPLEETEATHTDVGAYTMTVLAAHDGSELCVLRTSPTGEFLSFSWFLDIHVVDYDIQGGTYSVTVYAPASRGIGQMFAAPHEDHESFQALLRNLVTQEALE